MRNRILQRLQDKKKNTTSMEYYTPAFESRLEMAPTTRSVEEGNPIYNRIYKEQGGMYNQMKQYNKGGVKLPGGNMQPIPNSDAVQFNGASHDDGGILVDPQTEVEGGETMDQVTMAENGGEKKDYFFSDHLKEGGVSYANQHKEILANGGSQNDIDMLAKMQEHKAGRTTDKIQTASLGGVMKYEDGGTFSAQSDKSQRMIEILRANGYDVPDAADLNNPNISNNQKSRGDGYYSDEGVDLSNEANRQDFYNRNKDILGTIDSDGDGVNDINSWEDFDPQVHTSHFQNGFNDNMMSMFNNDPELMKQFEEEGYSTEDMKQFGFYDSEGGADTGQDGQFGQYTWSRLNPVGNKKEACPPPVGGCPEGQNWNQEACACEGGSTTTTDKTVTKKKKDWAGAALGLGSMIPAVMAFTEKPDYMESPDLQSPGVVKAERVSKQHLDRVDFNDQIARNANDATAMNKFIETSGGGPANIANKMAAYAQKQAGDRDIKAQEAKANIAISNEENVLDNKRKAYNAEAALNASKFNVTSQEAAESANIRNNMYVDEYNSAADAATKDRRLNAVQYGVNTLAQLHRDKLTSQASDNLASAVDGQRGALDRFFKNKNNQTTSSSSETTTTTTMPTPAKRGGYRKIKQLRRYGK
tara:strand:+ start:246 stop:2174 length:1929 start_codon:yes stop_codon:yes gene_type:complete